MAFPVFIGVVLAIAVAILGKGSGMDRDRAYYPVMLIVIAWYYILFAAISGSTQTLLLESIPVAAFMAIAVAGFRGNLELVAAGLVAHGLFDTVHGQFITNAGMPAWWPAFCASIDIAIGIFALWQVANSKTVSIGRQR